SQSPLSVRTTASMSASLMSCLAYGIFFMRGVRRTRLSGVSSRGAEGAQLRHRQKPRIRRGAVLEVLKHRFAALAERVDQVIHRLAERNRRLDHEVVGKFL